MTHADLLNRIRNKRIMYGDFAPWELDDDDPRQAEFQEDPAERRLSLPPEKKDINYLVNTHLPDKFGLKPRQITDMAARYIDSKRNHHDFLHFLREMLPHRTNVIPRAISSSLGLVGHLRQNGWPEAYIQNRTVDYLNHSDNPELVHDNLVHNAKIAQVTGKI